MQWYKQGKSGIDLAFGACPQDMELQAFCARRLLHASGGWTVRVQEQGDDLGLGRQLGQQLKPLGHQFAAEKGEAREVATRPSKAVDHAHSDWVAADEEDYRDCRSCRFRCL